ncbi:MAG TPA: RDD family protein, partial [Solirubrobacteraceae bacterium]|nr:RDD family protein [Solirubrobacteraceae bacterium]
MELEDFIRLATPEGVELEMSLAGVGSRMIAGGLDLLVKLVLIGALAAVLAAVGAAGVALLTIASFLLLFGYDVLFEVLGHGQTPGKRLAGLRVVRSDGSPVDLPSSAVRNIARLIDGPPLAYVPAVVGILVTRNNQRPGDLAGDTVVIRAVAPRRRRRRRRRRGGGAERALAAGPPATAADWDVSGIGPDELAVVRRFLDRRDALPPAARRTLALQLADGLRPRVTGAPPDGSAEGFLET